MKKVTRIPFSSPSLSLSLSNSRLKWAAWGHRGGLREGGRLGHVTARAAAAGGRKGRAYTHTRARTHTRIYIYIHTWKEEVGASIDTARNALSWPGLCRPRASLWAHEGD